MKIIFSFLLTLLLPFYLQAQNADEKHLYDKMSIISGNFYEILNDTNNDMQMRREKILGEVIHLFDFKLMARLSLDKKIRKSISKEQYKAFTHLFETYIKDFYLDRIDLLKGTSSKVEESTQSKKNRIFVKATLDGGSSSTSIIYKFYKNKQQKWFIYDLEIANVSVLQSYRAQFSSYLTEHTFNDLLIKLKQ